MKIDIRGLGDNTYIVSARELVVLYVKIATLISPFGVWKIYELVEPFIR